jgi:heme exporter protein B
MAAAYAAFAAVLKRDLLLAFRHRSEWLNPVIFYVIVVSLFPIAMGPEPEVLAGLAPAVIWVAALLAATLSLDRVFHADFDDGSLEQLLLSPHPLTLLVAAKILAHWLLNGLPLIAIAALLAVLLSLPQAALLPLLGTLLLGTPVFSLTGGVLAALTVGLRGGGLLLALLILPLLVPVLIFSVAAVGNAVRELPVAAEFYFLGAILVLAASIMPPAAAAALRARLG